jgi:hypothetical protein
MMKGFKFAGERPHFVMLAESQPAQSAGLQPCVPIEKEPAG